MKAVIDATGWPKATAYRYRDQNRWKEQFELEYKQTQALSKTIAFLDDPSTTEEVIADKNYELASRILNLSLSRLESTLLAEIDGPIYSEALQKLTTTLEKLTNTKNNRTNKGVSKKKVQIEKLDWNRLIEHSAEMEDSDKKKDLVRKVIDVSKSSRESK